MSQYKRHCDYKTVLHYPIIAVCLSSLLCLDDLVILLEIFMEALVSKLNATNNHEVKKYHKRENISAICKVSRNRLHIKVLPCMSFITFLNKHIYGWKVMCILNSGLIIIVKNMQVLTFKTIPEAKYSLHNLCG